MPARAMGLLRMLRAESFIRRLIRQLEYAARRPVSYSKGVVRKVRGG